MAGIFDGEGWISGQKLGFGQNDGIVHTKAINLLSSYNFKTYSRKNGKCNHTMILNGREHVRFLGMFRPERLLQKQKTLWEGRRTWHAHGNTTATILNLSDGGVRESDLDADVYKNVYIGWIF